MAARTLERSMWVDWPTIAALAAFWLALVGVIAASGVLPAVVAVVALAVLGGWYMSLQHEVIHGHPTPSVLLNRLFVCVPLGMLQPFARYRDTHLAHHASDLTNPTDDPESFYVLPATWQHASGLRRRVLLANRTLAFRLTVGPLLGAWRLIRNDIGAAGRDAGIAVAWVVHVAGCVVLIAVVASTPLPIWMYLVGFVYGGQVFTSLRSFAEHRAEAVGPRSALVRAGWFFSMLYLNNNLHYTHHQLPGAAWYRLPELSRTINAEAAVAVGAGVYPGYASLLRQYLLRPIDQPVHPLADTIRT